MDMQKVQGQEQGREQDVPQVRIQGAEAKAQGREGQKVSD